MPDRLLRRYDALSRPMRLLLAASWAAVLLIGVVLAVIPVAEDPLVARAVGLAIAVAAAYFFVRSWRWATIDVHSTAVVVRGAVRTDRIPLADIERFDVVPVFNGAGDESEALGVIVRGRGEVAFGDFWNSADGDRRRIERFVTRLNDDLREASRMDAA